jgi:hypothetical protein
MITLETLRTVLLSDQPYIRLDELVRSELSSGRLTKQIHDELYGMEDAVRTTPGFGENAEEALRDTIDALNGFSPAKYAYKNPPVLPTEEEIANVPHWAGVAFAARCARRVLPLHSHFWEGETDYHRQDVSNAVETAEVSAASGEKTTTGKAWANEAANSTPNLHSSFAAWAAADATGAIVGVRVNGASAVRAASGIANLAPIIRRDFDHLAKLAQWQRWTDDTPVPPEVFGPLWPEGAPAGWPADPEVPQRAELPLELLSRARVLEQMTEDEAVNLFNTINAYYIARTGNRLTMEDLRPLIAVSELAEV